ncbi:uncharacterized protein LOC134787884 [Penaeus indicus]|uniref:uncharacterized protein LOC134787884 n=1 Tax=Penaeus indicus TaxID=29960 RepID=UPI00300C2CA5
MEMSRTMLLVAAVLSLSTLCTATEDKPEAAMLRQFGPYGRSPDFQRNSRNDHHDHQNRRRPNDGHNLDDLYANHNTERGDFDRLGDLGDGVQDFGDNYFENDAGFSSGGSYRQQDNGMRSGGSFDRISKPGLTRRVGYAMDYDWRGVDRSGGSSSTSGSIDVYSILALGIFAAFLGYIVYYYISVNGGGRSLEGLGGESMMKILEDVTKGVERWAILELLPHSLEGFDISRLLSR